jgi:hypothetical protein
MIFASSMHSSSFHICENDDDKNGFDDLKDIEKKNKNYSWSCL